MIGPDSSSKSEGTLTSTTTLEQNFNSTYVALRDEPEFFVVDATDANWKRNQILIGFYGDKTAGRDIEIGPDKDVRITFLYDDGRFPGFHRIDFADRGLMTYLYDRPMNTIKGSFTFEVDDRNGELAYTFTGGEFSIEGLEPQDVVTSKKTQ